MPGPPGRAIQASASDNMVALRVAMSSTILRSVNRVNEALRSTSCLGMTPWTLPPASKTSLANKLIADTSLDEWQQVMDINLTGTFIGVREALKTMNKGSIVNVSSVLGIITPMPGVGSYAASKAGTRLLTKAAAVEAVKTGKQIRVNSVHPGLVSTDIVSNDLKKALQASDDVIPAIGKNEDVAKAVTYLASEESSYTTGAEIVLDGGTLAGRQ